MSSAEASLFRPDPRVQRVDFAGGSYCLVVDDALRNPEALRQWAIARRGEFVHAPSNAYPGIELPLPGGPSRQLDDFFRLHIRPVMGLRRTLRMHSRLAMATTPPGDLLPRQWLCHRDNAWVDPGHAIAASVLYLFEDASMGGTNFYSPRLPAHEVDLLVHDSSTLDAAQFSARHGWQAGYMSGSNAFFERVGSIAARWNRIIFYDGRLFHSGEIGHQRALNGDPATGRLTLNGFFTCSRKAA